MDFSKPKQSEQEPKNGEQEEAADRLLISLPRPPRPPPNYEIAKNSSCFSSSSSSTDLHRDVTSSQFVSTETMATTTMTSSSSKSFDKPRIWSLADVATSVTPPGGGGCYRRHVVDHTSQFASAAADLRSFPPGNDHVTSERSCPPIRASPAYRSFQPWTSVTSLPSNDAASASIRQDAGGSRENSATRLQGLVVANGNAVFCSFREERESNANAVPVPSDVHNSNSKYDSRHDFVVVSATCGRWKS